MVDYVIHADHPSDIREPQPSLRMKHKADLLECKYSYADKPPSEKCLPRGVNYSAVPL